MLHIIPKRYDEGLSKKQQISTFKFLRPTEEEMNEADARKRHLRVPKGTSDYQASWIFDAEEVEQDEDEVEDSEDDEVRFRY